MESGLDDQGLDMNGLGANNHTVSSIHESGLQDPVAQNISDRASTPNTSPVGRVHDGRAIYFAAIEGRDVESTKAYPQESALSPAEMTTLQTTQAFDLPSRAIKACYIDNFFRFCYPWAPIVERSWLEETATHKPSLLLLQSVLLAGSRVTSNQNSCPSSALYARAKALFFSNHERNPLTLAVACLLLQWWNPAGPERFSMDNSYFWHRTGVGIAFQIGLHQDGPNTKEARYRKRLWWALVVSLILLLGLPEYPSTWLTVWFAVRLATVRYLQPMAGPDQFRWRNAGCRLFRAGTFEWMTTTPWPPLIM